MSIINSQLSESGYPGLKDLQDVYCKILLVRFNGLSL